MCVAKNPGGEALLSLSRTSSVSLKGLAEVFFQMEGIDRMALDPLALIERDDPIPLTKKELLEWLAPLPDLAFVYIEATNGALFTPVGHCLMPIEPESPLGHLTIVTDLPDPTDR